jgi:hypothetical protein
MMRELKNLLMRYGCFFFKTAAHKIPVYICDLKAGDLSA